ncbi:hypothetical protein [Virgibacillus halodenitrificans]|nr:hypothetical protein [Virgibacillus halodenitrificans]
MKLDVMVYLLLLESEKLVINNWFRDKNEKRKLQTLGIEMM